MSDPSKSETDVMEPGYWRKNGWTARVVRNEDDGGWAVEVYKEGMQEPALVSPWVMGRDKVNPKPFDASAFATFVKTASEVLDRSARQREQALKTSLYEAWEGLWYQITLELVPDEYDPHAILSATNDQKEIVGRVRVAADYKLTRERASRWIRGGFGEL